MYSTYRTLPYQTLWTGYSCDTKNHEHFPRPMAELEHWTSRSVYQNRSFPGCLCIFAFALLKPYWIQGSGDLFEVRLVPWTQKMVPRAETKMLQHKKNHFCGEGISKLIKSKKCKKKTEDKDVQIPIKMRKKAKKEIKIHTNHSMHI